MRKLIEYFRPVFQLNCALSHGSVAGLLIFLMLIIMTAENGWSEEKKRIFVVSSYSRDYLWSQESNRGFCDGMLRLGFFENGKQGEQFTKNDYVETHRAVVKKGWMDAKRKNAMELAKAALEICREIREFKPDLIFLGDDEAGDYIGNQFIDSGIPMVFWGFNDNAVKYGLVETAEKPGHNVTGVYQSGYYVESLKLLKTLVPGVRTFAVLSDNSPSGRSHRKGIEFLARKEMLPLKLIESVSTDDFGVWKKEALRLQEKVDAFFVAQYSTLRDEEGASVPNEKVAEWYAANIRKPEATLGFFVRQGLLCGADDSGYNQAFEAVKMAYDILEKGAVPANYPVRTPARGALIVNRNRAKALGIVLKENIGIEEITGD